MTREREFFEGERVVVSEEPSSTHPEQIGVSLVGTITGSNVSKGIRWYGIQGDDGVRYKLKDKELSHYEEDERVFQGWTYIMARLNPDELEADFEKTLQQELGLVKKLLKEGNQTDRAATLATVRNLQRYLSTELDLAYQEADQLARSSDMCGRAAALATLRNLNTYLQERANSGAQNPA